MRSGTVGFGRVHRRVLPSVMSLLLYIVSALLAVLACFGILGLGWAVAAMAGGHALSGVSLKA